MVYGIIIKFLRYINIVVKWEENVLIFKRCS